MASYTKYTPYVSMDMPNRQWPSRRTTHHPVWLSTDLRDGNQSLPNPMTIDQKVEFFRHLVKCGFKEIEIAFPSASDTEFSFVRYLIEHNEIPDDVWIQVMTPSRLDLIERTFQSIAGAKHVIMHFYRATCPCFRELVYGLTKEETVDQSLECATIVRRFADEYKALYGTKFRPAFGLETYSQTEPDFVLEICSAVRERWGVLEDGPMIINLAATVEIAPPNHFADQVEYFCTNFKYRDDVHVGLHTHNDRGTAVAATEMALLAGADRVEGTLFGNGERNGNVDLVTLALNLYTQGIDPGLDFSDIQASIDIATRCTGLPVHPRHPYSGALVFTAFSGSHQDAIKKGFERQARLWAAADAAGEQRLWEMPYLPVDPSDIGRVWEVFVRINSQSGKGGSAFVIKRDLHVDMPRSVQQEFYHVVQAKSEEIQGEVEAKEIVEAFCRHFWYGPHAEKARVVLGSNSSCAEGEGGGVSFCGSATVAGSLVQLQGEGDTGLVAFLNAARTALGLSWFVHQHENRRATIDGHDVTTAFVLLSTRDDSYNVTKATWGIGADGDDALASIRAAVSAINKLVDLGRLPQALSSFSVDARHHAHIGVEGAVPGKSTPVSSFTQRVDVKHTVSTSIAILGAVH